MTDTIYTGVPGADIVVIGGGFAGLHSASELADAGHRVLVLESGDRLMARASRNNLGRIHHGWHYPGDPATAHTCVDASFGFLEQFADLLLGRPDGVPGAQTGWCILASGSFIDPVPWLARAEELRAHYAAQHFRHNRTFGPPEQFFQLLAPMQWGRWFAPERVQYAASTLEPFVDLAALAQRVIARVHARSRIQVRTGHAVRDARPLGQPEAPDGFELAIARRDGGPAYTLRARQVVNASWTSRLALDRRVATRCAMPLPDAVMTFRLKTYLHIRLPHRLSALPSYVFIQGPFTAFTNLADGTGLLSYAPVSNHSQASGALPHDWDRLLTGDFSQSERAECAGRTLLGADRFVPGIAASEVLDVRASTLCNPGSVNIYDPRSSVHHRRGLGVEHTTDRWLSIDTGKLSWVPQLAHQIVETIGKERITSL
ncbi:FAD-dependent oxidoreductase [Streptomyces sp. NPDC085929]|uniref:FAD-dependent oxidoreductase n=1 Tax=Streptomyces sp. NPDC085929 TaxID=3365739 RepID=UPI0037D93D17